MFDRHSDLQLIRKCKRGHEPSFALLLQRYRGAVYGLCYRMTRHPEDARDLAQEIFIKVFSLLDRFDESYAFSSWLFKIATNHCIDYLRRNRLRFMSLESFATPDGEEMQLQLPDHSAPPDRLLERQEAMERLDEVIALLPPHYRLIILLRHDQQLAYEEIAQILELPLGTVKARIHRARNMIQHLLKQKSYDL